MHGAAGWSRDSSSSDEEVGELTRAPVLFAQLPPHPEVYLKPRHLEFAAAEDYL